MWFVCRINTMQCHKISSLCLFGGKLGKGSAWIYPLSVIHINFILLDAALLLFIHCCRSPYYDIGHNIWVRVMASNAYFNNISVMSWRSVLLVEETEGPGENHRPDASHWQTLSHNVVSSTFCHEQGSNSQR